MNRFSFEAAIFDLDGVITQTASLHMEAWKQVFDEYLRLRERRNKEPFREFTIEGDYLPYIDGKPRYEGVKSFLQARGISLTWGSPSDSPDKETICGIGNKKNVKFLELLSRHPVKIYSSTIDLVKNLKKAGIKVGVASSSKSCQQILKSTALDRLFEVVIDGNTLEKLGLKGKPEPDIFVTATHRLKSIPAKTVIVEDAISGVTAGRNGGFGLVIGVTRKNNQQELFEGGADVVVKDLSHISLAWIETWFHKKPLPLFYYHHRQPKLDNLFDNIPPQKEQIELNPVYLTPIDERLFAKKNFTFFLDYDGTLTPIVEHPDSAKLSPQMKEVIKTLSQKFIVTIVSGRKKEEIEKLINNVNHIIYAGNHGMDIKGDKLEMTHPYAQKLSPLMNKLSFELKNKLIEIDNVLIENKKFSVAVHWRQVEKKQVPKLRNIIENLIRNNPSLRIMEGKKVFEIMPNINWHKGEAIRWIMHKLNIDWRDTTVIYIGDDTTDEDAFRLIRTRGVGILVSSKPKESAADFWVSSPQKVKKLLEEIIKNS